jgi:hypothetical protein
MRKFIFIFLLTIIGNYIVQAQTTQEYLFKVLASSGNNMVAKESATAKLLKTGYKITKEDKITLAPNSFLGLVHKSGRTLELKTPGTYAASDLSTKMGASQSSFNQKYVDFVIGEMTKVEKEDANKNRHQNMGVEGKVERGEYDITLFVDKVADALVMDTQPLIKWHALPGTKQYKVMVVDMFDEVLFSTTTADTSLLIDLNQANLKNETGYLLVVSSVDKPKSTSDKYSLKKLDAKSATAVHKKLADITGGTEETSLSKIIQASLLEENKLYLDALKSYEQAIALQPQVKEYQVAYQHFLQRHNLGK